jgi:hypothetical protein
MFLIQISPSALIGTEAARSSLRRQRIRVGRETMADERITERTDGITTERTVERDSGPIIVERRGGSAGWVLALIALVAVALLAWYLMSENRNDGIRTEAVTGAAASVAESTEKAADRIGDAADGK